MTLRYAAVCCQTDQPNPQRRDEIAVRVGADGDRALLEIQDTGVGIPPGFADRMFELFVQGERTLDRAQGGLGIGLTLARALVEMHGGTVEARSRVGEGTVFLITLPEGRTLEPTSPTSAEWQGRFMLPRRTPMLP